MQSAVPGLEYILATQAQPVANVDQLKPQIVNITADAFHSAAATAATIQTQARVVQTDQIAAPASFSDTLICWQLPRLNVGLLQFEVRVSFDGNDWRPWASVEPGCDQATRLNSQMSFGALRSMPVSRVSTICVPCCRRRPMVGCLRLAACRFTLSTLNSRTERCHNQRARVRSLLVTDPGRGTFPALAADTHIVRRSTLRQWRRILPAIRRCS